MDRLANSLMQLHALLGEQEGAPTPLEGGGTNRNYRARFGGADVVLRLPGENTELLGIDREAEWAANRLAAGVGVAPGVAARLEQPTCLVTHFLEGREMSGEELRKPAALSEVARALRRFHECGEMLPAFFSPFQVVDQYALTAAAHGAAIPAAYEEAQPAAMRIEVALRDSEHEPVPCHNDLLSANFIRTRGGIRIVDWEYAGMGDRYFDLGNLAVNNELDAEQEKALLGAYFGEPPDRRRLAALRLMRFMSDFREAMRSVLRGVLSDHDHDFAGHAAERFERLARTGADPRFEAWLEEASAVA